MVAVNGNNKQNYRITHKESNTQQYTVTLVIKVDKLGSDFILL